MVTNLADLIRRSTAYYRCQLCGEEFEEEINGMSGSEAIDRLHKNEVRRGEPELFTISMWRAHSCADGRIGIKSLIGVKNIEE